MRGNLCKDSHGGGVPCSLFLLLARDAFQVVLDTVMQALAFFVATVCEISTYRVDDAVLYQWLNR